MKKVLSITALLLAAILITMCCAACGGDESTDPTVAQSGEGTANTDTSNTVSDNTEIGNAIAPTDAPDAINPAVLISGEYTGRDDNGEPIYLTVNSDGTGRIYDDSHTADCVFNTTAKTVVMTYSGEPMTGTYDFDGSTLSITANLVTISFTKNGSGSSVTPASSTLAGSYMGYDNGSPIYLTINADNTGTLYDDDHNASCVFNPSTGTVDMTLNGVTVTADYTLSGSSVTISANGTTLTLTKTD